MDTHSFTGNKKTLKLYKNVAKKNFLASVTFTGEKPCRYFFILLTFLLYPDIPKIQPRDYVIFYVFHKSLIKMVYAIAAKSGQRPRWHQLEYAIRRNFGGLTEQTPVDVFKRYFQDADVSTGYFFLEKGLIGRQVIFS